MKKFFEKITKLESENIAYIPDGLKGPSDEVEIASECKALYGDYVVDFELVDDEVFKPKLISCDGHVVHQFYPFSTWDGIDESDLTLLVLAALKLEIEKIKIGSKVVTIRPASTLTEIITKTPPKTTNGKAVKAASLIAAFGIVGALVATYKN